VIFGLSVEPCSITPGINDLSPNYRAHRQRVMAEFEHQPGQGDHTERTAGDGTCLPEIKQTEVRITEYIVLESLDYECSL
jgi:hypothetical protein